MGIGDWGLGIGDWGLGPIPNPQSPHPQTPIPMSKDLIYYLNISSIYIKLFKNNYFYSLFILSSIQNRNLNN
jgi:hypothetical protein